MGEVKQCACGESFDREDWERLEFVGTMEDEVEKIEMRNCICGSTIAIEVER